MTIEQLLKKLDERGNDGADLSPGDPVCLEAAHVIREFIKLMGWKDFNTKMDSTPAATHAGGERR